MLETPRRTWLSTLAALALGTVLAAPAVAQGTYPSRPVRIVVPFPAGGPTDAIGRMIAQGLTDLWKSPVVVENKPGASGMIGAGQVAKSPADGYTLALVSGSIAGSAEVLNPKTVPYRAQKDFAPVGFIANSPSLVVVASSVPANTAKEFVALVKAHPGKYSYAQASTGSAPHFAFEMLKIVAGLDLMEVPFNGAGPAMVAVGGGDVQAYMGSIFSSAALLQTGKARPIGVASARRIPSMANIPTLEEQGFPVVWDTWYGLVAPAGTPEPVLERLNADMNKVLGTEDARQQMEKMGMYLDLGPRTKMRDAINTEFENATRVARDAKMVKE